MKYTIYKVSIEDYCTKFFEDMNKSTIATTNNFQDMVNKCNNGTENFKDEGYVLIGACINNLSLNEEICHPCMVSGSELHKEIANNFWHGTNKHNVLLHN